jgi:two-component system, response regulator
MSVLMKPPAEERVLVLAPTAADATFSRQLLAEAGPACHVCQDVGLLCQALGEGAGAVLLTEEALGGEALDCLSQSLRGQPPWSELPMLLLANPGAASPLVGAVMELFENVTILELPVRATPFVSALRAAVKARRRQYQLRDQMGALARTQESLRTSEGTFRRLMERQEFIFCTGAYAGSILVDPKVVLLDEKLPLVDGMDVLREIRADARTKLIPVVMLTSSAEDRDVIESYQLGVNSYIVKPVDFEQFSETARQLGYYWLLINQQPSEVS